MVENVQYTRRIYLGGWVVYQSDDGEYLFLERAGKPGRLKIKASNEGMVSELWSLGDEQVIASMCALWSDLQAKKATGKFGGQSYE